MRSSPETYHLMTDDTPSRDRGVLPPDDPLRLQLHNELHARPTPRIRLPALVVQVAVRHEGVSREAELEHLRQLSGLGELELDQLAGTYQGARCAGSGTPSSAPIPWCNTCPPLRPAPTPISWAIWRWTQAGCGGFPVVPFRRSS